MGKKRGGMEARSNVPVLGNLKWAGLPALDKNQEGWITEGAMAGA